MECIATEQDDRIPQTGEGEGREADVQALRDRVAEALAGLDTLRLRVLALILQEGLSVAETAHVLDLPEWRVHQECAQAVGQIRRLVCAAES